MQQINVEEIMEQIREDIKKKGYTADMLSFDDIPLHNEPDLDTIERMSGTFFLEWRRPVPSGIIGFIKRVIRKCVGFIIAPITDDQTKYNRDVLSAFQELFLLIENQQVELEEMNKTIKSLNKRIAILEAKK